MKFINKKNIILFVIIILVLFLVLVVFLKGIFIKNNKANEKLYSLAGIFYDYYYEENKESTEEKTKEFFSEFKDKGLTVNLSVLKIYLNNRKEEDFSVFKNCDDEKTKVIVYPTSPFNKDDYKVETVLSCK